MSQTPSPGAPRRLEIRKYPNRRYYDTTRSCHVTLEQIHGLIRQGYEVQVIDSKTGQDITGKILAQIIIDLDAPKLEVFPVAMLHRLLQSNQEIIGDFVHKYFNQPLTAFLDSQRNVEQYFRQAMGLKSDPAPVSDWTRLMWGPFNPSFWKSPSAPASASPAPQQPAGASIAAEKAPDSQAQLKRQVAELNEQLARLKGESGGRPRGGRAGKGRQGRRKTR